MVRVGTVLYSTSSYTNILKGSDIDYLAYSYSTLTTILPASKISQIGDNFSCGSLNTTAFCELVRHLNLR